MNESDNRSCERVEWSDSFWIIAGREQQNIKDRFAIGRSIRILAEKEKHEQQLETVDSHRIVVCENVEQRAVMSWEFERRERGLQELGELRIEHIVSSFVRSAEGRETVEKLRRCEWGEAVIRAPLARQVLNGEILMGKYM